MDNFHVNSWVQLHECPPVGWLCDVTSLHWLSKVSYSPLHWGRIKELQTQFKNLTFKIVLFVHNLMFQVLLKEWSVQPQTVCCMCGVSYCVAGPAVGDLRPPSVSENTVLHALYTWVLPQVSKRGLILFHLCGGAQKKREGGNTN